MFTGIVQAVGQLASRRGGAAGATLRVAAALPGEALVCGESVAVDGVCLTVTTVLSEGFEADVSAETLDRTTLGLVQPPAPVNLERALRLGDRVGGHLVTGHVDARGTLVERVRLGAAWRLRFALPADLAALVVAKGSIAVAGVSLTVNACAPGSFDLVVVPHTAQATTLGALRVGASVNLETDILGKYVVHRLGQASGSGARSVDEDFLRRHGFA